MPRSDPALVSSTQLITSIELMLAVIPGLRNRSTKNLVRRKSMKKSSGLFQIFGYQGFGEQKCLF